MVLMVVGAESQLKGGAQVGGKGFEMGDRFSSPTAIVWFACQGGWHSWLNDLISLKRLNREEEFGVCLLVGLLVA